MKKSLILLGMLSIGYAYAQEGNVGINTETPKATLEIAPNATNLAGTTNEGIIIPKLTKARVVAIAADKLVEGTKVYVTDDVTAADTQFVGTGKGFYFYNGTKWVKQLDSENDTNSELWAQRDNAGVTETYLKPADADGNKLFYARTPESSGLFYIGNSFDARNTVATHITDGGLFSRRYNATGYGASLLVGSGRGTYASPEDNKVGDSIGRVVWEPTLNGSVGWGASVNTFISEIRNEGGQVKYATNLILGARALDKTTPNYTMIINGKNDRVGIGTMEPEEKLDIQGNIKVRGNIYADQGSVYAKGSGDVGSAIVLQNNSKENDNQAYEWKIYNMTDSNPSVAGGYKNALAFWSYNKNNVSSPSNRPQFIITDEGNVGIGSAYIYTNSSDLDAKLTVAGTIKTSSLAQTGGGDRVVYADENGVLKTGGSIASNNGVQTQSGMTCTAENAGKINYTTIQKDGKDTGVFGFCMQKGTEYVWAYMLGGSNIYGTSANGATFGDGL